MMVKCPYIRKTTETKNYRNETKMGWGANNILRFTDKSGHKNRPGYVYRTIMVHLIKCGGDLVRINHSSGQVQAIISVFVLNPFQQVLIHYDNYKKLPDSLIYIAHQISMSIALTLSILEPK